MARSIPFRDMQLAPRDGTAIEVRHGPAQEIVRAEWSGQAQAWICEDDPDRRTLHRVTGWRPVPEEKGTSGTAQPALVPAVDTPVPPQAVPTGIARPRIVTAKKPRR